MPSAACASARVPTTGLSAPRGQLRIWTGRSKSACRISARRSAFGVPTKVYGGSDVWRWKSLQSAAGRRAIWRRLMPFADMPSRLFVRGRAAGGSAENSGDCGRADMYGVRKEPGGLFRAGAGGKRRGGDQRTGVRNRRGGARGGTARKGKDVCRAWLRCGYLLSETELPADAADAGKRRRCLKRISAGRRAASIVRSATARSVRWQMSFW